MYIKHQPLVLTQFTESVYTLRHDLRREDFEALRTRLVRFLACDSSWVIAQYRKPYWPEYDVLGWSNSIRLWHADVEPPRVVKPYVAPPVKEIYCPTYEERNPKNEAYPGWGGYYND